jgi:hypothetical protein
LFGVGPSLSSAVRVSRASSACSHVVALVRNTVYASRLASMDDCCRDEMSEIKAASNTTVSATTADRIAVELFLLSPAAIRSLPWSEPKDAGDEPPGM